MNPTHDSDAIDRLLFEDAAHALPDDGFSARVLRALPPPGRAFSGWRPLLILGSTALGCALAFFLAPADASLLAGFVDLAAARFATPAALGAIATAAGLALTAFVVAVQED